MKILITGANGQLGKQLIKILSRGKSELGDISEEFINAEIKGSDIEDLDITSLEETRKYLNEYRPDLIINPAAYTNVDGCEENQETAFKVNAIGARNIAIVAEELNSKIIHISTDYIFEGNGEAPYREYDVPNPQSVYGKSKWMGEEYVKQFSNKWFIVRTSWVYGYNGKNFVKTMINLGNSRDSLKVVNDQKGNPTNAEDLAHHILKIASTEEYGVYNCTGEGECTWFDFASEIMKLWDTGCIVSPCTSDEFPQKAKRPSYSSLENMMLDVTVGNEMRNWKEALKCFKENFKEVM